MYPEPHKTENFCSETQWRKKYPNLLARELEKVPHPADAAEPIAENKSDL